jgi:CDP-diacylglycerol---glycerol-3-phosphate 3-phosphatidyltransferase
MHLLSPLALKDNRSQLTWVGHAIHQVPVNLPNSITLSRIVSVPVLLWILSARLFEGDNGHRELLASAIFILASITDGVDGYLARKRGQISNMGVLLDPLADKLLIAAALIVLVQFNPRIVPPWVAVLVIGREFLVTGLRGIAASEGFTIQASDLGKLKMVLQIVAVVAAILDHHWQVWSLFGLAISVNLIAHLAVWLMVIMTLVSAIDYFVAFWTKIDKSATLRQAYILSRPKRFGAAADSSTSLPQPPKKP